MTASLPVSGYPQTPARKPGPGLGVSISLMVLGTLVGIASAIAIALPLVGTFTSREYAAPMRRSLHLRHARYTVFERSGSSSGFGIRAGPVTIDPSQVTVIAPDGEVLFVFPDVDAETITRGSDVYTGAVQFDVPATGDYDIRLSTRRSTSVVIARSLKDAIRSVLVWFGTGAIGGIVLVGGLVMLIVGVTRRGRARRAMQVGWGQAGWGQPNLGQPNWGPAPQYPPPNDPWAPRPP